MSKSKFRSLWYVITVSGVALANAASDCGQHQGAADASVEATDAASVRPQADAQTPPLAVAPFTSGEARSHQEVWASHLGQPVEITNSIGMKFRLIPPGEFMMGSPQHEIEPLLNEVSWLKNQLNAEQPLHRVRITRPFYLGVYEVTQSEYERVMGHNPSDFSRGGRRSDLVRGLDTSRFPVERVSWEDAVEFCRRLSALSEERAAGRVYRLPTEAEWEYACRAGTTTLYHVGDDLSNDQARFHQGFAGAPVPVGSYKANGFGLYDMHGNMYEWCADWYDIGYYGNSPVEDPAGPASGSLRVARGGGYFFFAWSCRSAFRYWCSPELSTNELGFRVAVSKQCEKKPQAEQHRRRSARSVRATGPAEKQAEEREIPLPMTAAGAAWRSNLAIGLRSGALTPTTRTSLARRQTCETARTWAGMAGTWGSRPSPNRTGNSRCSQAVPGWMSAT